MSVTSRTEVAPVPAPELAEKAALGNVENRNSGDRRGLLIAAAVLLACSGLVGYGVLTTEDQQPKPRAVPTAEVTYEVTGSGTAEISYLGHSESGTATVETSVTLPWKKSVQVPLGKNPTVGIVLDGKGGQASCTLAVRGKHVQRSTAMGGFGRATCTGQLPAADGGGSDRG
ncbi:MmpS family transport accessory protein [Streptomyces sp. NPDC002133]|uniref:MmpS family transport accessory protein n=1 Tax=Streptomyces sp. NPDC002133 TaxID=3154409 RepID=UPI0033241E00